MLEPSAGAEGRVVFRLRDTRHCGQAIAAGRGLGRDMELRLGGVSVRRDAFTMPTLLPVWAYVRPGRFVAKRSADLSARLAALRPAPRPARSVIGNWG